ncbi:MAG TPA: haloacid dehalogenase-like hydrolase [Longimicrobiaceae bacterium]|nr:haloacid dehalogenase-like hydrolase [Longimicrobiaceae bacterium]
MRRLVLFDIDGTLLTADGAGRRAFHDALVAVFGTTGPIGDYSFAGRTDPQIARELLSAGGVEAREIELGMEGLWRAYLRNLEREVARIEVRALPGVHALLERVEAEGGDVVLGLLTGNVAEGARLKLERAGIGFRRFRVGAFGSDHADRPELPAVAVRRAEALTGHRYQGKEIVIVGDTPFDISCGEHLGVRTIAVATGGHPAAELAACGPDHLFPDLCDTAAVWEAISGE